MTEGTGSNRFLLLDALRGIAALAVVFQHLYGNIQHNVASWFPTPLHQVFTHGYLGVPIFFVISGFVITHSVDCSEITPRYVGMFALRRAIRLDPPYWATIGLGLLLFYIKSRTVGISASESWPDSKTLIAHFFYAQDLLGYSPLSAVFWTLCLEIQLYLSYILFSGLALWFSRRLSIKFRNVYLSILISVGLYSAAAYAHLVPFGIHGLFIPYWHFFLLGVLSYQLFQNEKCQSLFFFFLAYEIGIMAFVHVNLNVVAASATALLLFTAIKFKKIQTALNYRPVQYLGRISYSLYIIHADIGWKVISAGKRLFPSEISIIGFLVIFTAGLTVSILVSHLLWLLVEKPSNKLSKILKRSAPTVSLTPVPVVR